MKSGSTHRPFQARHGQRGFTLIELMTVVVIVGVLAVLAVVSYRKLVDSSKVTEATGMVQAIRIAQESYHAEAGVYASIASNFQSATYCPVHATAKTKLNWDPTCNGGATTWSVLPVRADGALAFGYATVAGAAGGTVPPAPSNMFTAPSLPQTSPADFYVIAAQADTDGNGKYCTVVATSWSREVYVDGEGE